AVFKLDNVEDLYEIGVVLGSGHFGQVREVRDRATDVLWAGKFLKLKRGAGSRLGLERKSVEKEVEILQSLQHQNIMGLKDVFESKAEVVLIIELIKGGELFDFIAEKENLTETEAIEFMKQILEGVKYMHQKNIAHFDLKPENIMLLDKHATNPDIKIIDFGMAQRFIQGEEYRSLGGTPQYIGDCALNYFHFHHSTTAALINITIARVHILSLCPVTVYLRTLLLIHFCTFVSSERMTADECLIHPWIKPLNRTQIAKRNRSSINMKNFRKFNAKRKWRMSFNMVSACNRFTRLQLRCKDRCTGQQELRDCESDQEDTATKPASLLRRRLSSNS
ncbi:putative death-associated protein kinase 2, partial [Triplophysa rosa]